MELESPVWTSDETSATVLAGQQDFIGTIREATLVVIGAGRLGIVAACLRPQVYA